MIYLVHHQHNKKYSASHYTTILSCVGFKKEKSINLEQYSNLHRHRNISSVLISLSCGIYIFYNYYRLLIIMNMLKK